MGIYEFLQRYFIGPIQTDEGYNLYNTIAYGILLIAGAFGVLKLLRRLGVRMDRGLFNAAVPFLFFAGFLRALEEFARLTGAGPLPSSPLFLTPGIYFLVASLALASLLVGYYLGKDYRATMTRVGFLLSIGAFLIFLLDAVGVASGAVTSLSGESMRLRPSLFLRILVVSLGLAALGYLALQRYGAATRENGLILWGFAYESTAVALAVSTLGYSAEQPMTQFIVGSSPLLYVVLKLGLAMGFLYYLEKEVPTEDETHWLTKFLLLILTLPMGLHDSLQVFLGL